MKDAYYFPHDSDSHTDPKIIAMLLDLKAEGYGVFWVTIEMLRSQTAYILPKTSYDAIAYQSHSSCITVAQVIENYNLFTISNDGSFYSESLTRRMKEINEKREKYRQNANKRWSNAIAMQSQCNGNAVKQSKVKQSKVKQSKVNICIRTHFQPPTLTDVISFFKEQGSSLQEANTFYDHFTSNGWKVGGKAPMKDWQAAVRNWIRRSKPSNHLTKQQQSNIESLKGVNYDRPVFSEGLLSVDSDIPRD